MVVNNCALSTRLGKITSYTVNPVNPVTLW